MPLIHLPYLPHTHGVYLPWVSVSVTILEILAAGTYFYLTILKSVPEYLSEKALKGTTVSSKNKQSPWHKADAQPWLTN